uniref:Uncharacterized protein LOC116955388 n=1 Tax=Petromyzon marinus TaxID=7757 RepID=A0AAJ7XF15_PETMA|nr:uncharacterized protein LOC116955388 [Petromyzon marinus]XP_032832324.1 uncharacterized protein LOC116955388 [Petromyzon marinus]
MAMSEAGRAFSELGQLLGLDFSARDRTDVAPHTFLFSPRVREAAARAGAEAEGDVTRWLEEATRSLRLGDPVGLRAAIEAGVGVIREDGLGVSGLGTGAAGAGDPRGRQGAAGRGWLFLQLLGARSLREALEPLRSWRSIPRRQLACSACLLAACSLSRPVARHLWGSRERVLRALLEVVGEGGARGATEASEKAAAGGEGTGGGDGGGGEGLLNGGGESVGETDEEGDCDWGAVAASMAAECLLNVCAGDAAAPRRHLPPGAPAASGIPSGRRKKPDEKPEEVEEDEEEEEKKKTEEEPEPLTPSGGDERVTWLLSAGALPHASSALASERPALLIAALKLILLVHDLAAWGPAKAHGSPSAAGSDDGRRRLGRTQASLERAREAVAAMSARRAARLAVLAGEEEEEEEEERGYLRLYVENRSVGRLAGFLTLPAPVVGTPGADLGLRYREPALPEPEVVWCGRASCGSRAAGLLRYRVCGRCKLLRYCSVACQRADWRDGHRARCVAPPPPPPPPPPSNGEPERHLSDGFLEGTP